MKRFKLFFIIVVMLLLIPLKTNAMSITSTYISADKEWEVGSTFYINVNINFNGLNKESVNSDGVAAILYELDFNDSVLAITDVSTDAYDSSIFKNEDSYYIMSIIDEDSKADKCIDGLLSCDNYEAKVYFYVKDTKVQDTSIKVGEVTVGYYNIDVDADYAEEDIKVSELSSNKAVNIVINQTNKKIGNEPNSSVISGTKPSIESDKVTSVIKSDIATYNRSFNDNIPNNDSNDNNLAAKDLSNCYLKLLDVEDYFLNFDKDKYHYTITIPQSINSIKVNVEPEEENAKVEILGANDLKKNNDIVKVNVTSEDGHKKIYVIEIKRDKMTDKEAQGIVDKLNMIGIIVLISVFIIGILAKIVSLCNKRKLNKFLNN